MSATDSGGESPIYGITQGGGGLAKLIMANYLDDFEGKGYADSILVTEAGVKLPNTPCKFVKICNWNTNNDSTQSIQAANATGSYIDTGTEVYYGFHGIIAGQIFPAGSTELLPVSNLNEILLQTKVGGGNRQIWFMWWV
jgi:hypothetical protein